MPSIISQNANQNLNEIITSHLFRITTTKKRYQVLVAMKKKGNAYALLIGMYIVTAIMINRMELSQKNIKTE